MNLKTIISMINPISFWRMESYGGDNIYDDYGNNTLVNHNCTLGENGSSNVNLSNKSVNIKGGYIDHTDTGFLNDLISEELLHISFNFKCSEEVVGVRPIVSKWYPENQWFVGFENGILIAKVQTDTGPVQVEVDNPDVIYNGRWNHCSFIVYNGKIRLDVNGVSNYKSGITEKDIVSTQVVGINSPFMIGGNIGYSWNTDFWIMDFAITKKDTRTLGNDIRPLYILTRDLEDRFLDLAPPYYFNVYEAFIRGNSVSVNKGTKGSQIKGYLTGDLSKFEVINNSTSHSEEQVKFPPFGDFRIADDLELNLVGNRETNVIINGSFSGDADNAGTHDYLWFCDFYGPNVAWRFLHRIYMYSNDPRAYTYVCNEAGNNIQSTYNSHGNTIDEMSRSNIFWVSIGKNGSNHTIIQPNTKSSALYDFTHPTVVSGYNPPTDYNYTYNRFWYGDNELETKLFDRAMGSMALFTRQMNSLEVSELKYPESYCLYTLLKTYGDIMGWWYGGSGSDQMRYIYTSTYVAMGHYGSNYQYVQHNDNNSNRLNLWNATSKSTPGQTSSYISTYQGTVISIRGFMWNQFIESTNYDSRFIIMRYKTYNTETNYIVIWGNSANGEYSLGNIEVIFDTVLDGSFSTTSGIVVPGGYHMITLVRDSEFYELWINGKIEATFNAGAVVYFNGNCKFYSTLQDNYMNDWFFLRSWNSFAPKNYKEIIEYILQGFHHKVSGTTYLKGIPLESAIHTLDDTSLQRIQTNQSDTNGKFSFNLAKTGSSSGKYLMSLPINENSTANVVVHGPYETSVTYDQISEESLIGEEVYDMTMDFEPFLFYPMNDASLPILDHSGNSYDATSFTGSNYEFEQPAFEDQSKSIRLHSSNTYLNLPSDGIFNDISTLTINVWFNRLETASYTPLFQIASNGTNASDRIYLHANTTASWSFGVGDGVAHNITTRIDNNIWTMATLRINGDLTYDLLINGVSIHTGTMSAPIVINRNNGKIGYVYNGAWHVNAYMSHFSAFDYAVPNEELNKMSSKGHDHNANTLKSTILFDNPQCYYTFDLRKQLLEEISGYDLSLNGSVDYNKNSVIVNKDVVGNNYMYNGDYHLLPVNTGGTIEFAFKTTGDHTQSILLSEWNDNVGEGSYKFQLEASDVLKCYVLDDFHFMETTITKNEWHLVILTIITGNLFKLYVDNVLVDSIELLPLTPPVAYEEVVNGLTPLAYYRLGEQGGAIDETGNYNGIFNGEPTLGQNGLLYGNSNNAISFDGVDDQIVVDDQDAFNNSIMSYAFLCQGDSYANMNGTILITRDGLVGTSRDKQVYINASGLILFYIFDGSQKTLTSNVPVNLNEPNHIVCIAGSSNSYIYLNGVEVATLASTGSFGGFTNAHLLIGGESGAGGGGGFTNITLDEISYFDYELTQSDVNSLYASTIAPTYQDAVKDLNPYVYYRLGDVQEVNDDFTGDDGDPLNPDLWSDGSVSGTFSQEIINNTGQIRFVSQVGSASKSVTHKISLSGDIDVQVDFDQNINNLSGDQTVIFGCVFGSRGTQLRYYPDGSGYDGHNSYGYVVPGIPADYKIGQFRYTRIGNTVTAYIKDATYTTWTVIWTNSNDSYLGNATPQLILYSNKSADYGASFDNFIVNQGNPTISVDAHDEMAIENIDIDDDFTGTDNDAPNPLLWKGLDCEDGVTFPKIENNSLRLETIGTSNNWCQAFSASDLKGDFDIEFEMDVSQCPASNSGAIQFRIDWESGGYTNYIYWSVNFVDSGKWYQHYAMEGGVLTEILVAGNQLIDSDIVRGRMTRVGNLITCYKHDGSDWVSQGTNYTLTSNPDEVYYRLYQSSYSGNPDSIGFINYVTMNSGNAIQNNHGTYLNSPTLGESGLLSSNSNTAVTFDGVDQSIDTGIIYTASANRTWGCLIKPNNVASNTQIIFGDMDSGGNNASSRLVFGINGGVWYINIGDGSSYYVDESVLHNMVQGTTYHIIVVQDGLDYLVYVDSVLVHTFTSTVDANVNGVYKTHIGRVGEYAGSFFDGTIDEPFIIDSSLTQSDIDYLYNISKANQVTPTYTPYEDVVNALTPIAYYRMNDQQVTTAMDETGTYHGTYVNSPTLGEDALLTNNDNTAVTFDGVDQYVNCGNIPVSGGSQSFSFLVNTTTSTIRHALSKWENEIGNDNSYLFEIRNNAMKMLISTTGGDAVEAQGTIVINDGQTHHIVGVFETTTKLAVYIDGELDIETTTGIPTSIHNGSLEVWLSAFDSTPNDLFLASTLDEVCLFEKALTQSEITSLYRSSKNLGGGEGTPVYALNRMTIGSDDQGSALAQIASPTWLDDVAFYHNALPDVRKTLHYDKFVDKKHSLIGTL